MELLMQALHRVAPARGITRVSRESGISRRHFIKFFQRTGIRRPKPWSLFLIPSGLGFILNLFRHGNAQKPNRTKQLKNDHPKMSLKSKPMTPAFTEKSGVFNFTRSLPRKPKVLKQPYTHSTFRLMGVNLVTMPASFTMKWLILGFSGILVAQSAWAGTTKSFPINAISVHGCFTDKGLLHSPTEARPF